MERAGDQAHLSLAARSGWTLITHNARDFTLLHAACREGSRMWEVEAHHAGILALMPPVSPAQAPRAVLNLLQTDQDLAGELYTWRRATGWVRGS